MRLLVTAGPTREAIDPVRFLSNRSSGKMGYAIAAAAAARGHEVTLLSGPVALEAPAGIARLLRVESAREMHQAAARLFGGCEAAVCCAAVADYRPVSAARQKIKKSGDRLILELERTEDILGSARTAFGFRGVLVGFAAETERLEEHARAKLAAKGCDLMVANDVSRPGAGFDSDLNALSLFHADGARVDLPLQEKALLGEKLVEIIEGLVKGDPALPRSP